jgi:hypothetical protein
MLKHFHGDEDYDKRLYRLEILKHQWKHRVLAFGGEIRE